MKLSYVHLYSSTLTNSFLSKKVSTNLQEFIPFIDVDVRPFTHHSKKNKIDDSYRDNLMIQLSYDNGGDSSKGSPADSQNSSNNSCQKIAIIDGFYLQRIYSRIIDENESQLSHFHLVFEDNLVCTYDEIDKRYHARPIICGSPSIISIPSIIEGPAKAKGYYFKQMLKDLLSISSKEIENEFASTFISYDDPRLTQVATGYVIQAIFFFLTNGNPFCSQYPCRLFNSHWQEELIYTQVINPVLCEEHLRILAEAGK
ncbi:hypothetical protein H7X64_04315 [Armatimonadetes bacterium]|nr:hypothetical protein [bacterium]